MDIAKAFEVLSQGKIISSNSSQYTELVNMLLTDNFFDEVNELVNKIGFRLIGENGYYYMTKKKKMSFTEQELFINRHRTLIVAIAFLRRLYPRLDRGNVISFIDTVVNYGNVKSDDSSIRDQLIFCSRTPNKEDEKTMLEQLFKHLEDRNVIEKVQVNNTNQYKVLDAVNYYLTIVDSIESGE